MKIDDYTPIAVFIGVTKGENGSSIGMLATGHKETGTIRLFIGNVSHLDPTDSKPIQAHLIEKGLELNLNEFEGFKRMLQDSDDFLHTVKGHLTDHIDNDKLTDFLKLSDN